MSSISLEQNRIFPDLVMKNWYNPGLDTAARICYDLDENRSHFQGRAPPGENDSHSHPGDARRLVLEGAAAYRFHRAAGVDLPV